MPMYVVSGSYSCSTEANSPEEAIEQLGKAPASIGVYNFKAEQYEPIELASSYDSEMHQGGAAYNDFMFGDMPDY